MAALASRRGRLGAPGACLGLRLANCLGVEPLGEDVGAGDLDGAEFVASDLAVEDFLAALRGVEAPPVRTLDERNRKRKVVVAEHERRAAVAGVDRMRFVVGTDEPLARGARIRCARQACATLAFAAGKRYNLLSVSNRLKVK